MLKCFWSRQFSYNKSLTFWHLNNDYANVEWGYLSFSELKKVKINRWLEVDCEIEEIWKVKTADEIEIIRKAHGRM